MSKNPLVAAVEEGVEALRSGRRLRSHTVSIQPPPKYSAVRIAIIRKEKVGVSQVRFARFLGVSPSTVRAWEQRQRAPSLMARRLLQVADERPEALRGLVEAGA